ncbi:hypothetical protein C2W48_02130, partial [Escherichia coli]
ADLMFSTGVSHFWLDIQWYLHQALTKAGVPWDRWTAVIRQDLALLLERLPGLEKVRAWKRLWAGYRPVRASPRHASACYCDC